VSINGHRFSSSAEMPAAERRFYDDTMQVLRDSREMKATMDTTTASPCPAIIAGQSNTDTGLLTKRQIQLIILFAGLVFAVALMLILRH
jgi:hypothetical protein